MLFPCGLAMAAVSVSLTVTLAFFLSFLVQLINQLLTHWRQLQTLYVQLHLVTYHQNSFHVTQQKKKKRHMIARFLLEQYILLENKTIFSWIIFLQSLYLHWKTSIKFLHPFLNKSNNIIMDFCDMKNSVGS